MNNNRPHFAFTYIICTVFVFLMGCTNSASVDNISTVEDVIVYLKKEFPEYKLIEPSMVQDYESPIPDLTKDFMDGIDTGYEVIHSFDLNNDGFDDYLTTVYRTYELQNNTRYDSVFEAKSVTIFGGKNLISTNSRMYFGQAVFNESFNFKLSQTYKFTNPGYFKRSYPFNDSVYIERKGIGAYTPYGIGITEWINIDSANTTVLYAY